MSASQYPFGKKFYQDRINTLNLRKMEKINKKIIIAVIAIVLVAVIAVAALYIKTNRIKTRDEVASEIAAKTEVKSFAISGRVSVISRDSFEMKVGWVEKTSEGNKYAMHDKKILIDSETKFSFVRNGEKADILGEVSISNLQLNEVVTAYGTGNPFTLVI